VCVTKEKIPVLQKRLTWRGKYLYGIHNGKLDSVSVSDTLTVIADEGLFYKVRYGRNKTGYLRKADVERLRDRTKKIRLQVKDSRYVDIEYGNDRIYITPDKMASGDTEHYLKIYGDMVVSNRFVTVGGKHFKVEYASLTREVAGISEDGEITWCGTGDARFRVALSPLNKETVPADTTFSIEVTALPIRAGMSKNEIVEALGALPDRQTGHFFAPHIAYGKFEGIAYQFSTNEVGKYLEHWHYKKYPGLIVSFGGDSLYSSIKTQGWDSGYAKIFQ
jgi:hypothetical protein